VRRTVPPSAEMEQQIDRLLAVRVGENPREALSELAKLGARLIIQRAVEEEFDAWLGRARDERRPDCQRGLRNGFRPRRVQTAEGELSVEMPQVRQAAEPFVSKLFPRGTKLLRTEPLRAMVIGAFVRGLSMRDVESLCEQLLAPEADALRERIEGGQAGAVDGSEERLEAPLRVGAIAGAVDVAEGLLQAPGRGNEGVVLEELAQPPALSLGKTLVGLEQAVAGAVELGAPGGVLA
jgi:Transposase, Mutator family